MSGPESCQLMKMALAMSREMVDTLREPQRELCRSAVHSRRSRDRQPRALIRIRVQHFAHGGADGPAQFESQTSFTLPLVLALATAHGSATTGADNRQRLCTPISVNQCTTPRRSNDSGACPSPQPHHCCTHNSHLPAYELA